MSAEEQLALIAALRDLGVSRAKFNQDGQVTSVTFGSLVSSPDEKAEPTDTAEKLTGAWERVLHGGDAS